MNSSSSWLSGVWDKVTGGIDFVIDDWIGDWSGQNDNNAPLLGLGGRPYAENTPPLNPAPTEAGFGFNVGNNAATWGAGLGLALLAVIVYKAVK